MSDEISSEEIAALLARGSEEMPREKTKVKTFDILRFVADNAGLSMFEAIEKAYYMGLSEQESVIDEIRAEIEQAADKQFQIAIGVSDLNERHAHIQMENAYRHSLNIIDKYMAEVDSQESDGDA